jgi:FkbM family methyltransferase
LCWQIWQDVVRRPWTIRLIGERRLRVYPHSDMATDALYFRMVEPRDMRFAMEFLKPGDVFVDVGANVGVYSLLASSIPDVNIESFEPSPPAFSRLAENVRLNGLEARVVMHRDLVGDVDGVARLTPGRGNHITFGGGADAIAVPIVRLDSILPRTPRRIALMRFDVAGREAAALAGAAATLAADRPALIVEGIWENIEPTVTQLGYARFDYDPATRELAPVRARVSDTLLLLADVDDARRRVGSERRVTRSDVFRRSRKHDCYRAALL